MVYNPQQTWADNPAGGTAILAANLNTLENATSRGMYSYGLSTWGLTAATLHPLASRATSGYGGTTTASLALARCWIPAGVSITNVWAHVTTAASGTVGVGPNGFAVYEISGTTATLNQSSASDSTIWTTVGWRGKALASVIASQGSEREILLGLGIAIGTVPNIGASIMGSAGGLNKNVSGTAVNLSYYITGQATWPTTINMATAATDNGVVLLGVS